MNLLCNWAVGALPNKDVTGTCQVMFRQVAASCVLSAVGFGGHLHAASSVSSQ